MKPVGRDDYTLTEGMADKTIAWIRSQQSVAPNKPFFIYFAPGATHEPQQAPKAWIDRFQGKFDMGWDRYREDALARQKALGIVPKNTKLSPRPPEIPAWASLSDKEKKVQARAMEVFAGMMAQTDYEIGRVIDAVRDTGQLDNTMIVFITGDNGASQEGGPTGASNTMAYINGVAESLDEQGARLAALDPKIAGIASERAAQQYGLHIISHAIQDDAYNRTRFAIICLPHTLAMPEVSGKDSTSLIVSVPNRPGAVHDLLVPLKKHGVSMTRFESRPARTGQWEYYFYIDLDGHPTQANVARALDELRDLCAFYKVLGAYPVGS